MSELLPEGWSSSAIRECCNILDSQRIPLNFEERAMRQGHYPYYGANGIQGYIDDYIFDGNAILVAEDGGNFDQYAERPIAQWVTGKFWVNNHAHILRAKKNHLDKWIFYSLVHKNILKFINGGTRAKLNQSDLREIQISLPPLDEQSKIVSILTSVDEVIENTQKQIYKLEDLKKATMNELLTKGIGHTEFRDSELGRIPKSWEILEIHKLFDDIKEFVSENSNLPLFSLTMVDGLVPKPDRYVRDFLITDKSKDNYKAVRKNELVMNPMNLRWGAIASHHADFDVCVSKYYNVISLRNVNFSSQFYEQLFQSKRFLNIYEKIAVGTLDEKKRVHWSDFKNIKVPVPPVGEQKIIGEVIDASAHNLKIKKKKLTLIQSLKKSLMQDLLTGKVRAKVN